MQGFFRETSNTEWWDKCCRQNTRHTCNSYFFRWQVRGRPPYYKSSQVWTPINLVYLKIHLNDTFPPSWNGNPLGLSLIRVCIICMSTFRFWCWLHGRFLWHHITWFQSSLPPHWPYPSSSRPSWPLQVSSPTLLNKSCSNRKSLEICSAQIKK